MIDIYGSLLLCGNGACIWVERNYGGLRFGLYPAWGGQDVVGVRRKDVVRDEGGIFLYGEVYNMMRNCVILKLWARLVMLSLGSTL